MDERAALERAWALLQALVAWNPRWELTVCHCRRHTPDVSHALGCPWDDAKQFVGRRRWPVPEEDGERQ